MASQAYWKGSLKLSLVTCPIALYPASTQAEKTHFHQINTKTGHRLKQQMVDEQTGRVVDKDHKGRGYELSKGRYVQIEEEELYAVRLESTHTIEIDDFVPAEEIDERYPEKPYYIVPNGKAGADAFVVIRDAMKERTRWRSRAWCYRTESTSSRSSLSEKACSAPRCDTRMSSGMKATTSTIFRARKFRRTWWTWRRIFSTPRRRNSIPTSSKTSTRAL